MLSIWITSIEPWALSVRLCDRKRAGFRAMNVGFLWHLLLHIHSAPSIGFPTLSPPQILPTVRASRIGVKKLNFERQLVYFSFRKNMRRKK